MKSKRITFSLKQVKVNNDAKAVVPAEVIGKGEQAVKNYLWNSGAIDDALDYAETFEMKTQIFEELSDE